MPHARFAILQAVASRLAQMPSAPPVQEGNVQTVQAAPAVLYQPITDRVVDRSKSGESEWVNQERELELILGVVGRTAAERDQLALEVEQVMAPDFSSVSVSSLEETQFASSGEGERLLYAAQLSCTVSYTVREDAPDALVVSGTLPEDFLTPFELNDLSGSVTLLGAGNVSVFTNSGSNEITVSGSGGGGAVSLPNGRVAFGDSSSELTSSQELTWSGSEGFKEFTVGAPLTVPLIGRQTYDASLILNAESGFQSRGRIAFADDGREKFDIIYTPAPGDAGLHFLDNDKIVNRITIASGTNSTLHLQLHLLGDGQVSLTSTAVVSGTNSGSKRGIGIIGTATVTGPVVADRGDFSAGLTVSGIPVQLSSADVIEPAIVGSNGIQVASGTSTITINGTSLLPLDGTRVMSGALRHFNGTVAAPGLSFSADADMGIYHAGKGVVGIAGNGLRVATFSGTASKGLGVDGDVTATATIASPNAQFSNSLTISGVAPITQVKIPFQRIPFGSVAGVITSNAGLTWQNSGTFQDVLVATHIGATTSGTDSDPWLHGGDTVGRTSGLSYISAFGVFPIFTWSIQGVPTYRIVSSAFGARQVLDVGVGVTKTNMTMFGRMTGTGNSVITLHNNTTAQRDALASPNDNPSDGSIIYNTTVSGFQGYRAGSWRDFVLSSGTGANVPTFTPSSTADAAGRHGDVTFDLSFVYVKTSAGWKRSALSTF